MPRPQRRRTAAGDTLTQPHRFLMRAFQLEQLAQAVACSTRRMLCPSQWRLIRRRWPEAGSIHTNVRSRNRHVEVIHLRLKLHNTENSRTALHLRGPGKGPGRGLAGGTSGPSPCHRPLRCRSFPATQTPLPAKSTASSQASTPPSDGLRQFESLRVSSFFFRACLQFRNISLLKHRALLLKVPHRRSNKSSLQRRSVTLSSNKQIVQQK